MISPEPSEDEIAAEVESFLADVAQIEVHESFFMGPEQIKVAVGHDLHSSHKFMNLTFYASLPDENGIIQEFNIALNFEAANKLVNDALSVGAALWGSEDDDDA